MMLSFVNKVLTEQLKSIEFKIRLRPTICKVLSPPQYRFKIIVALLDTNELLEPINHVLKAELDLVLKVISKCEEKDKWLF